MSTAFSGAASVLAVAATTSSDPFDKSPQNPHNMSRTTEIATATSNAPSGKLLDRIRVAATDLAQLASIQAGWRYVAEKNNTTVYEMNGAVLPPSVSVAASFGNRAGTKPSDYYLVKGVTSVRADPETVLSMLSTTTTNAFALRMNQIFGRHYLNGVVIDPMSCFNPTAKFQSEDGSIRAYTEDDAYAVNWLSLKAPSSSDNARDFTFASYQDAFVRDVHGVLVRLGRRAARDPVLTSNPLAASSASVSSTTGRRPEGRMLGVHVMSSFNFKDVPELPRHKYTDRMHLRTSGFVVEETNERGIFRLSFFLSLTPVAATLRAPKKFERWLQTLALSVGNLALQLETPTSNHPETRQIQWKRSDHCALCLKSFHTFRRCHHCRFCGESVCNKCSGFVDTSKLHSIRALPGPGDHYAEMRGCTRCIHSMMDESANVQSGVYSRSNVFGGRSSSRSSGRHNSVPNDQQRLPASPYVHQYEDDEPLSSVDSNDSRKYSQPRPYPETSPVPMVQNTRQYSDEALTLDDLDGHGWAGNVTAHHKTPHNPSPAPTMDELDGYGWVGPVKTHAPTATTPTHQSSFPKPPLDPKRSNSVSTVSTSHSLIGYDDPNLRISTEFRNTRTLPPHAQLAGLSLHNDLDLDDAFSPSARTTESHKSGMMSPPRPTTSSTSSSNSGSFKFSLMNHYPLQGEPDAEPHHESFAGPTFSDPRPVPSPSKLFSASAGPRLLSQQFQSRPPRRQTLGFPPVDRSRASSSSSSAMSLLPLDEMMLPIPSTATDKNDMILLAHEGPRTPKFIEFSDSHRESICVRPGDGSDMIPLQF